MALDIRGRQRRIDWPRGRRFSCAAAMQAQPRPYRGVAFQAQSWSSLQSPMLSSFAVPAMGRAAAVAASAASGAAASVASTATWRNSSPFRRGGSVGPISSSTHEASSGTAVAKPRVRGERHWAEDIRRTGHYGILLELLELFGFDACCLDDRRPARDLACD